MAYRYIAALELAGSQIRGAVAKVDADTSSAIALPEIIALETEDKPGCVQYGRVQNLIDAANISSYVIQKLENKPEVRPGKITSAFVALAGRSLASVKTSAELALPTEMEITVDIIDRLFKEATKAVPPEKKVLSILPRKYTVDNQVAVNPVGSLGSRIKGDFTIVTCSPVNRRNLELVFDERLQLKVEDFIVTPIAVADLVLGEEEKQRGCVLVDMGYHTTTVSVYRDRALQYLATLPLGSNNITADLANGLKLTAEQAELSKRSQANATFETTPQSNLDTVRINRYVEARLGEIVANIMAQIGFSGFKTDDLAAGFILTGRGVKLRNFARYLEAQSKMPVRMASVPATISAADGIDTSDYVALAAIVARAAATDSPSCLTFPAATESAETSEDTTADTRQDAPDIDDDDIDDDSLLDDFDAPERTRKPEKGKGKKKGIKTTGTSDRDKRSDEHESLLEKLRTRVTSLFSAPEELSDDDLDEN